HVVPVPAIITSGEETTERQVGQPKPEAPGSGLRMITSPLLHTASSMLLHFRDPIRDPQSLQDFRGCLFHGQWLLTSVAVLSDRFSISCRMRAVVTPKAPWKVRMAKIVRVSTPSHFQVRKNIAVVNRENRLTRMADVLS